jgi:hypothetical protein
VKFHSKSVVQLHDLYHRKEGDNYIIGNPETGEYMFVTPVELRAVQLVNANISLGQVEGLLMREKETVLLGELLRELAQHRFIHKIDNRVVAPKHEPLHEVSMPHLRWLAGPSMRFVLILLSLYGLWTLFWYGDFPSYTVFFVQDSLTVLLLAVIVFSWLLIAARQVIKYAAAQHLGIPARFGLSSAYHLFIPKVYVPRVSEEQEHYVLSMSLLSLTALTSVALMLSTFVAAPYNYFWTVAFAIGLIEILSECVLFMNTDLAKFVAVTTNVHKLNDQTARTLKEDLKLLFHGRGKPAHPAITAYAFYYLLSIVIAIVLLGAYVLPAVHLFITTAFSRFVPGSPYFVDAFIALLFLTVDLLLYGFALLKHHPLSRNSVFVNGSLLAIVVASYIAAAVGIEVFSFGGDMLFGVILTFGLGAILALLFEHAVRFAYPFSEHASLFSHAVLPVIAACVPLSVLFTVTYTSSLYVYALVLGIGMLTALTLSHLHKMTAPANF